MTSNGRLARVFTVVALMLVGAAAAPNCARAQVVTSITWRADLRGTLAVERFNEKVLPFIRIADFNRRDFLRIILGRPASSNETLALTFELANPNNGTNIFLSVYNTDTLSHEYRTGSSRTIALLDNRHGAFTSHIAVPESFLFIPGSFFGGGDIQISGVVQQPRTVPAAIRGRVAGLLVDIRPEDLNGTTGIIMHATINTRGKPLRVQPPNVLP
jgi:hypothetical protein